MKTATIPIYGNNAVYGNIALCVCIKYRLDTKLLRLYMSGIFKIMTPWTLAALVPFGHSIVKTLTMYSITKRVLGPKASTKRSVEFHLHSIYLNIFH